MYSNKITLIKNFRGVYDLDISKGCSSGLKNNKKGCYYDCYAYRNSKRFCSNFKTVHREFKNQKHIISILNKIDNIDMPFIRIGVSGDPSENWDNLINILKIISYSNKPIVIITKHWKILTIKQLNILSKFNIFINTSISALDKTNLLKNRLVQYNRLKDFCKSILRIVSCDFNIYNLRGLYMSELQNELFLNENIIDTVFRPRLNNPFVKSEIINIKKIKFMNNYTYASMLNKNTFTGFCNECPDMCGLNI